jgi:hypothetical protein
MWKTQKWCPNWKLKAEIFGKHSERNQKNGWQGNRLVLFSGRPNFSKWSNRELTGCLSLYYASPDMIYNRTLVRKIFCVNNFYIRNCQEFLVDTLMTWRSSVTLNKNFCKSQFWIWFWQDRASSNNSNKLTNQMKKFYKFITWSLCVAQHVSGASTPIIGSLQLHW